MASSAQDRAARRVWTLRPFVVLAAVSVVLVATSCSRPSGGMASPPSPTGRATIVSPQPSMSAGQVPRELAFTAPRLGGGTIRGATYAGQDLVVWFWAPW